MRFFTEYRSDHTLKKGEFLTLRRRVLLHQGTTDSAKLPDAWENFSKQQ